MRKVTIAILLVITGITISFARDIPRTLYVLNGLGRTLSKMNLDNKTIENDIAIVGDIPNRLYTREDKIYVLNSTPASITVIDAHTDAVEKTIVLLEGGNPYEMAFVSENRVYVTNLLANTISIVNLESGDIVYSIDVGIGPEGILVVNNTAYVANSGGYPDYSASTVSVIDIRSDKVTKTLRVPANPQALALAPDGSIHVICSGNYADVSGNVAIIDPYGADDWTAAVVDTVEIGGMPGDIAITDAGKAFLSAYGNGSHGFLYAYDALTLRVSNSVANPLQVGKGAMTLFFDRFENELYVSNFADDAVQKLDPNSGDILDTFGFGDGVQDMAVLGPISSSDPWADSVVAFTPGANAGFGQNFFPSNVLGPPDPDPVLSSVNPSSKPQELLSLGHGGEIVLAFSDNYVVDAEGADFIVFENAYYIGGDTTQPFIEAARVAVSQDGENWVEFPWDTTTFAGFAGVTPTKDNQNPTDPNVSGGDVFDLADVGLSWAAYIKLTDIGDLKSEGAWNGDFDLDAVVAVNSQSGQPSLVAAPSAADMPKMMTLEQNYPNPFNPQTRIEFVIAKQDWIEIKVYNLDGQLVKTLLRGRYPAGRHQVRWDGKNEESRPVASGIYLYEVKAGAHRRVRQMTLLR
ncbi:T9SS type A sorting domain-containing protein [candidate division KSB1 bacterium]|nr:T9SS type A sorting domain-containing protein [candidate division KSB1 bacterium]